MHRWAAVALAIALFAVALTFMTTVAGGADAYGYVSQADLWRSGLPVIDQPWMADVPWPSKIWSFAPLGYRPFDDQWAIAPIYSAGLPLIMSAFARVGGQYAVFWVVPLTGIVLVMATYGLGLRLTTPRAALAATFLVATSPIVLFMIMPPMTDLPVAAFWTAALFFLLSPRATIASAAAAGSCASIAVLIRPNLATGSVILGLWYVRQMILSRRDRPALARAFRAAAAFAITAAAGLVVVAMINQTLYGSPWRAGYGDIGYLFGWANVLPNMRHYFGWLAQSQTPLAMAGFIALLLPLRAVWPSSPDRFRVGLIASFVIVIWAQYCYYQVFDAWWFLRFLLPTVPVILIALANLGDRLWARGGLSGIVATAIVIVVGLYGVWFAYDRSAFHEWQGEARYVTVARRVRAVTDRNSVIFAMQHSGSVRYYGSRVTIRFDFIDERWLDRAVDYLSSRGIHAYALLDEWEVPAFQKKFAEFNRRGSLAMNPVFIYQGPNVVTLYDLAAQGPTSPPTTIVETYDHVRFAPMAPWPRLVWAK